MSKKQKQKMKETKVKAETETKVKLSASELKSRALENAKKIIEALGSIEDNYFEISELLYEAMNSKYWIPLGYQEWDNFVADKFGMKPRKADYYVGIQKCILAAKLTKKALKNIGWSKMAAMYKVISSDTAEEWLTKAKKTSLRDLIEMVKIHRRSLKTDPNAPPPPVIARISLSMGEDKMVFIDNAIAKAMELLGEDNKGLALSHICAEWVEARGIQNNLVDLQQWISYLEPLFGIKIEYVEVEDTGEELSTEDFDDDDAEEKPKKKDKKSKKSSKKKEEPEDDDDSDDDAPEEDDEDEPEDDDSDDDDDTGNDSEEGEPEEDSEEGLEALLGEDDDEDEPEEEDEEDEEDKKKSKKKGKEKVAEKKTKKDKATTPKKDASKKEKKDKKSKKK